MAVVFAFMGRLDLMPIFVGICLVADFADGMVARALKVNSPLGADLDSLADMVSFGFVPGLILFLLIDEKMGGKMMEGNQVNFVALIGFMVTLFSALRLAIFNNDENQTKEFVGLATPASTVFVVGILLLEKRFHIDLAVVNYIAISVGLSLMLVSKIRMFSFKISSFTWKDSAWQYIFLALSILSLIWLKAASVSLIIVIYVLMSIAKHLVEKKRNLI
ncbi:MAG: CDP-diacylglycerol--serine O-phosphatidyltransferase [Planctomycetota bacterium]|jgi:CDP-diacylglycerol--serine O-phosphatidyltransferase